MFRKFYFKMIKRCLEEMKEFTIDTNIKSGYMRRYAFITLPTINDAHNLIRESGRLNLQVHLLPDEGDIKWEVICNQRGRFTGFKWYRNLVDGGFEWYKNLVDFMQSKLRLGSITRFVVRLGWEFILLLLCLILCLPMLLVSVLANTEFVCILF